MVMRRIYAFIFAACVALGVGDAHAQTRVTGGFSLAIPNASTSYASQNLPTDYFGTYDMKAGAMLRWTESEVMADPDGSFRDGLYVAHISQDTTSYPSIQNVSTAMRLFSSGPYTSTYGDTSKDIVGIEITAIGKVIVDARGVCALCAQAVNLGNGITDNEVWAINPGPAGGSSAQSKSVAGLQAVVSSKYGSEDATHISRGILVTNIGKQITAGLQFTTVGTADGRTVTATISIASPGVVTASSHGFVANDAIVFTTTGALPTGITAGTTYYVISAGLGANQFQFSATLGGAAVNTSGTQSGVQTVHAIDSGFYKSMIDGNPSNAPAKVTGPAIVMPQSALGDDAGTLIEYSNASGGSWTDFRLSVDGCYRIVYQGSVNFQACPGGATFPTRVVTMAAAGNVATTTCGAQLRLSGAAFYNVNFTAPGGYATNCSVEIVNDDTLRAKFITASGFTTPDGLSGYYLWPSQKITASNNGGAWKIEQPGMFQLPGGTYNVYTNYSAGDDTWGATDGLSAAQPFRTVNGAFYRANKFYCWSALPQTILTINPAAHVPDLEPFHAAAHDLCGSNGGAGVTIAGAKVAVTGAANNGAGLIRITTASTTGRTDGDFVCIYGVVGTTEANGCWAISGLTATTFDLDNSTFSNAYVSGGTATNGSEIQAAVTTYFGTVVLFRDMHFYEPGAGSCFHIQQQSFVYFGDGNMIEHCGAAMWSVTEGGRVRIETSHIGIGSSPYMVTGNLEGSVQASIPVTFHYVISFGYTINILLTNTQVDFRNVTFDLHGYTITGKRFELDGNAVLLTSAADPNSVLPGNAAGTCTTGAQAGTLCNGMIAANNLSDLASIPTSRTNLGLGTAALTNYSQGNWTPVLTTDGTAGTPVYSIQDGKYEIIGRSVLLRFTIQLSNWTGGPTGNTLVAGLPVSVGGGANQYGGCYISSYAFASVPSTGDPVLFLTTGGTSGLMLQGGGAGTTTLTAAHLGTTALLTGVCNYNT